jgi:hypothetical protein
MSVDNVFAFNDGLTLPVGDRLELVSLVDSSPCQSTRIFRASVPVTPPSQCCPLIEIAEFLSSDEGDDEDDETTEGHDLYAPDFSGDEDDDVDVDNLSVLLHCGNSVGFPNHHRSEEYGQPQDPDSSQVSITYYRALTKPQDPDSHHVAIPYYMALTKLATSMRLSEETRSVIKLQRRVLRDVYGHLDTDSSLLCGTGSGAASDYEASRNALMLYICDAMEQATKIAIADALYSTVMQEERQDDVAFSDYHTYYS